MRLAAESSSDKQKKWYFTTLWRLLHSNAILDVSYVRASKKVRDFFTFLHEQYLSNS